MKKCKKFGQKILAGEIVHPKSTSLRTLEKLRNISSEEALSFQEICKFALQSSRNTVFLIHEDDLLQKYNCNFSDILRLEECGLISANGFISVNLSFSDNAEKNVALYNNELIGIIKSEIESQLNINAYAFTNSGIELYKIITNITSNNEYFLEYLRKINSQEEYDVKVYKIEMFEENRIRYDDTINLL